MTFLIPELLVPYAAIAGSGYIGFASDIWSLGIILFAFVFGVLPFSYCGDDYARVYEAAIQGKLYFPNKIGRGELPAPNDELQNEMRG